MLTLSKQFSLNFLTDLISEYLHYIPWYSFRIKNKKYLEKETITKNKMSNSALRDKESSLQKLLALNRETSFLEIGIGPAPNIDRIKVMLSKKIKYTGCDFKYVCQNHQKELKSLGLLSSSINYAGNEYGTYAWTLFEFIKKDRQFDNIYIDGSHTFYIDLPVFVLAHYLLKPGGFLIVDDLEWTLIFLKKRMVNYFHDWVFYHRMYDFSHYSNKQQNIPHIKLIVEELIIKKYKYKLLRQYNVLDWHVFRKPVLSHKISE